jgi:hypothetical protein
MSMARDRFDGPTPRGSSGSLRRLCVRFNAWSGTRRISAQGHKLPAAPSPLNRAPPRPPATYPPGPSVMIWPIRSLAWRSMSSMRS